MKDYRVTFMAKSEARLVEHEFDAVPKQDEIIGRNILSLISTGSERGGFTQDFSKESYPMETGSSSIARVIAVGDNVRGFATGDLFYHNEHHTLLVRVNQDDVIAVPKNAKPQEIIFGRYAAVSMTSIYRMRAKATDNIIVTGQGLVGSMCAAVLQCQGFNVYAIDPSAERREAALCMGIINVGESLEALGAQKQSCGTLLECSGNENAVRASLLYLRHGGEVFQVGVPWHKCSDWDAHSLLYDMFYGYISMHGGWEWSIARKSNDFAHHSSYSHISMAMELIASGKITIPKAMYELRDPRECNAVYTEISVPKMRPTSMMFDWRSLEEETA